MDHDFDQDVIRAIGEKMADVGELYRSAAEAADDPALKSRLEETGACRRSAGEGLLRSVDGDADDAGTALGILDKLSLKLDEWAGDADDAAVRNANSADADLLGMIENELNNRELGLPTQKLLRRIASTLPKQETTHGLTDLAEEAYDPQLRTPAD